MKPFSVRDMHLHLFMCFVFLHASSFLFFFLLLLVLQYAVYELATVRKWLLLSYFAEIFHVFYGFLYTVF